jgi:long-chain acyl-CoA synthetase
METKVWHKFWPKEQPWLLDYPEVTVDVFLRTTASKYPRMTALVFEGVAYTYQELWEGSQRFAAALADFGLGKGDVVALHLPNCPQLAMAYYGILISGATFSPANPLLSERELTHQLNDCGAKAVLTYDEFASSIMEVKDKTKLERIFITSEREGTNRHPMDTSPWGPPVVSFMRLITDYPAQPPQVNLEPKNDLAHLAYTGGTTGQSKGVMLTHYNVVIGVLQTVLWEMSGRPVLRDGIFYFEDQYPNTPDSHWEFIEDEGKGLTVNVVPWFHAMGTIQYLNNMVTRAYTIVLHKRFDPVSYLDDVEKYRATYIGGAPPMFMGLLNSPGLEKRNLSTVKRLISGAAPLPVEAIGRLRAAFPNAVLVEAYGLTEVVMGAIYNPGNWSGLRKAGSVGIPLYDTDIKLMDLGGLDREVPVGEEGEIWLKGPQVMKGYYNRPEETVQVLRDGWLSTGDLGRLDEDGYLTIVDRKKDMLIYKGYNVYPRELEELLFQHPAVLNCTVIGIPDPNLGDLPKAFVVLRPGVTVSEKELMAFVNQQVTPYKKIREVEFCDSIPISATGKILKRELRRQEEEKLKGNS